MAIDFKKHWMSVQNYHIKQKFLSVTSVQHCVLYVQSFHIALQHDRVLALILLDLQHMLCFFFWHELFVLHWHVIEWNIASNFSIATCCCTIEVSIIPMFFHSHLLVILCYHVIQIIPTHFFPCSLFAIGFLYFLSPSASISRCSNYFHIRIMLNLSTHSID